MQSAMLECPEPVAVCFKKVLHISLCFGTCVALHYGIETHLMDHNCHKRRSKDATEHITKKKNQAHVSTFH